MRNVLLAALPGILLMSGVACADGTAPISQYQRYRPCANWAGVYAGAHIGAAWASTDWTWKNDNFFDIGSGDRSSIDPSSAIAGFHGGVQHQLGCAVLGLEGTFSGGDITKDIVSPFFPDSDRHSASISRITTVTGRLGYSWDHWLVYGKGGYAGANVALFTHDLDNQVDAHSNVWQSGWTAGAGVEVQLGHSLGGNIILGVEYNYINLGSRTHTLACAPADCGSFPAPIINADVDVHAVTARLTFLLGRDRPSELTK
jgi:outer membrane immunogenic protein